MQSRTANELVEVTKQFESLGVQDSRKRKALSEKQTSSAQQLVVINSMLSHLGFPTTAQSPAPQTALRTEVTHDEQSRPETPSPTPVTARRVGAFRNVNWQDVRPFTPANPQVTTQPKLGNHQHIDPIVQARPSIQTHAQRPRTPLPNSQPKHHGGAAEATTPASKPSPGFVGTSLL